MNDPSLVWDRRGPFVAAAATRSLASVAALCERRSVRWIVVLRIASGASPRHYALRSEEVAAALRAHPQKGDWSIERALDLRDDTASLVWHRGRGPELRARRSASTANRIVDFDADERVVAVGEPRASFLPAPTLPAAAAPHAPAPSGATQNSALGQSAAPASRTLRSPVERILGSLRGGGKRATAPRPAARRAARPPLPAAAEPPRSGAESASPPEATTTAAAPPTIDVTLSAETKAQIKVGATELVEFRAELAAEAMPLAARSDAKARADLPIVVALSIENDAIVNLKAQEYTIDPPAPGAPRSGFFVVKAARVGATRIAVSFRQGGSELGAINLAVDVVEDGAGTQPARATAVAAPRDVADDEKLTLMIESRSDNGQLFYEYTLHSEALGLAYRKLRSKPLLDRGGGAAASTLAYIERIYERVTQELKSWDDLKKLQREARALGVSLCDELLDPEVARLLWPLRDQLKVVQLVSWEPYIPWELVRLRDPQSGEVDERFLAQYGLVRLLSGEMPPRQLPMKDWNYLGATFPMGSFPPVGAELGYFTDAAPAGLRGRGIEPAPVAANCDAVYELLADGAFDVLHISCHAESPQRSIERASLIIGDETATGAAQPRLIEVDTLTVAAEAQLKARHPLVFLNACETGRAGAVLTAWGGWPNVFVRAGAGAFVGASWAVRDKPAAAFAKAFYETLLDGGSLAEAATAARNAAAALGDASWLAYKVYGHPRARRT